MFVKFKVWWQDGLYQYNPGKVVELPPDMARRYCESGKAEPCAAPKWAIATAPGTKKKKIPSARQKIQRMSSRPKITENFNDIASEVMRDEE
jgi:hypothetical protein